MARNEQYTKPLNSMVKQSIKPDLPNRKFSVAPMMEWTDRHYRFFARLLSQHALLYTEMVTTGAILFGDEERHLAYNEEEHPIALQLGGSDAKALAQCSAIAQHRGYDEVNLNVGCPSDRVQNNMIGACLMGHKELVRDCVARMRDSVSIPITVKHRIGIDDLDSEQFLLDFVGTVAESGCETFIVHARKAILEGLSPKENREIPPLMYERVYRLKKAFPNLEIIINGGIKTLEECDTHLEHVDGVMVGREAYQRPWLLAEVDTRLYGAPAPTAMQRKDAMHAMFPYIEQQLKQGLKLSYITRHVLGLFHGKPGGKQFRRHLSENAHKPEADLSVLEAALALVKD